MEILRRLPNLDLKNNVVRRRLTHVAVGTLAIGMTVLGAGRGNNQDSQQILLPQGTAQGYSDISAAPAGNAKEDELNPYKNFNTQFDRIYQDIINSPFFDPFDNLTITKADGSTIKFEVYNEGGGSRDGKQWSSKMRRVWTSTPFNPPGREFLYSTVIYDVKTGQDAEKTVINVSISPEGIIRSEMHEVSIPKVSELDEVVAQAAQEFEKQKLRHQASNSFE